MSAAKSSEPAREVVLIAGGASAVGLQTARVLARQGASIALYDAPGSGVRELAAELVGDGIVAVAFEGDVSAASDLAAAAAATARDLGGITRVVASAAVERAGAVHALDAAAWERSLTVNLTAVFLLAKQTVPQLIEARGSFVAVTSLAAVHGTAKQPGYAAAMHGVIGLMRTMAVDYGPKGVRFNVVCAGPTDGDGSRNPFRRPARPEEVAGLVAHLASSESSYTNGSVQIVDGGASAGPLYE